MIEEILKADHLVLDVRTEEEFEEGHAANALNIPLHNLPDHWEEILGMKKPVVTYCRSGARSSQATSFLKAQGIEHVYNAGGLQDMLRYQK